MQSQVRATRSVHGVPRIPMDTEYAISTREQYWRIANLVRQREKPCNMPTKPHARFKFEAVTACLKILLRAFRKPTSPRLSGYELHERLNHKFDTTFNSVEMNLIFNDARKILRRELRLAEHRFAKTRSLRTKPAKNTTPLPKETAC